MRSKHPAEFETTKTISRTHQAWSEEELRVLAFREANLPPSTRFKNQALLQFFPERSLESLKGARNKNPKYRELLQQMQLTNQSPSTILTPTSNILPPTSNILSDSPPHSSLVNAPPHSFVNNTLNDLVDFNDFNDFNDFADSSSTPSTTPSRSCNNETRTNDSFATSILESSKGTALEGILENPSLDIKSIYLSLRHQSPKVASNNAPTNRQRRTVKNRHKVRKFARYQRLYLHDKHHLADLILDDSPEANTFPSEQSIRDTFQNLYESNSPIDDHPFTPPSTTADDIYHPITIAELKGTLKSMTKSSPGPDGITLQDLKVADPKLILTLLNYQLWVSQQFSFLKNNQTILIPKKKTGLDDASNWRPITISSYLVRLLHKILAKRMVTALPLNPRQKAFTPVDGCAQNVHLLDTIIREYRRRHLPLSILGIDLAKAFDTVSIYSIRRALFGLNINEKLIAYIIDSYTGAVTNIKCGPHLLTDIRLRRGVKQGDPLSPIIFNVIMDELLRRLPEDVGVKLQYHRCNSMAFADDLILLSETKAGMNLLLETTTRFFDERTMNINEKKCFSLRTDVSPKSRIPITHTSPSYFINQHPIFATSYSTVFTYLGISFNPCGKVKLSVDHIHTLIFRLSSSPLKPQQKLHMLTTHLIPRLTHKLVLGRITKGMLNTFDGIIRQFAKSTLHLPLDTPDSYIHSSIRDGGLGVPPLIHLVPRSTIRRIAKFHNSNDPIIQDLLQTKSINRLQKQAHRILGTSSTDEAIKLSYRAIQRRALVATIDGRALKEAATNHRGQLWITGLTKIVSGKGFINLIKLRIGRLPTKENCNRGREADKRCRHCKRLTETLTHVLQGCHFSHFQRMRRHDNVARLLQDKCLEKGHQVLWEPVFNVPKQKLKPDLVVVTLNEILVIDVSIVAASMSFAHRQRASTLYDAWKAKVDHYSHPELLTQLKDRFNVPNIWVGAMILSDRGLWCVDNDITLKRCGLPLSLANTIVVRAMEGSVRIWKTFMRSPVPIF